MGRDRERQRWMDKGREGKGWMERYTSRGEWGGEGEEKVERDWERSSLCLKRWHFNSCSRSPASVYQLKTWGWLLSLRMSTKLAPKGTSQSSSLFLQRSAQWCINVSPFFLEVLAPRVCYVVVSLGILHRRKANGIENQQIFQIFNLFIGFIVKYVFLWPTSLTLLQIR